MGEKSKKEKKAKRESLGGGDASVPTSDAGAGTAFLSPIAKPLADEKLCKKVWMCRWMDVYTCVVVLDMYIRVCVPD